MKMKRLIVCKKNIFCYFILTLLSLSNVFVFAQNETNNWFFGRNAGLNFDVGDTNIVLGSGMFTPEGCTSISDYDGNLMFYSNGENIWNRNHEIMDNGDNLFGDVTGVQTAIIIPKPNDVSTYYIFYTRENAINSPTFIAAGIYYSEIKFTPQNPLGSVVIKNQRIANSATSRLAAIYHNDTNSYKLITVTKPDSPIIDPNGEELFVFRIFTISSLGIDLNSTVVTIIENIGTIGTLKISPNGQYIAIINSQSMKIFAYEYDIVLDNFQLYKTLPTVPAFGLFLIPYGLEFSQDSNMLYYTGANGSDIYIVQIQFSHLNDMNPPEGYFFNEPRAQSLQLARNGKIYVSKGDINSPYSRISVINKPEKFGIECAFQRDAINFSPNASTKGLPIFVASSLRNRIIVSDDACVNTSFDFELDLYAPIISVEWDFGDGAFSNLLNPSHTFITYGFHKVKATIITSNRIFTLYKTIEVFPPAFIAPNQVLTQCDNDNDGFSVFNLENISDFISNANSEFEYYFYTSSVDAQNDENRIQNPINYTNRFNSEEIFVKIITEKGCPSITSFIIENVTTTPSTQLPNFYTCENSDTVLNNSEGIFDLDFIKLEIISILNTPPNYEIKFYPTYLDAQTKLNEIGGLYTSTTREIWIRIEDENNSCNGVFSFTIVVNEEIEINIEEKYTICDSNVQSPIVLDGGISNTSWTWRNISLQVLSTERFFPLVDEGKFSVVLVKEENGLVCTETIYFDVYTSIAPTLQEIRVDNDQIFISVRGTGNYEFSLDNITYSGSSKSHTFTDLEAGIYTIYVRDVDGCLYAIQENVLLVKFPRYFTPNGDGINDYWKLYGPINDYYSSAELVVYDRYGNLLYTMNFIENNLGWDGTFNNKKLPATDYWYKIIFKDFNDNTFEKKGHFSLTR